MNEDREVFTLMFVTITFTTVIINQSIFVTFG